MEKMVSKLVFKMTLLMLMFQLAKAAAPVAKPNCPDHCGNISIPYPFGIGKYCYMAESYDVECDETSKPPRAFLRSIKMELVNITLTDGAAIVNGPIMSSNCSDRQSNLPALNLTGSPFFFSFGNVFTAVGCNVRALLTGIGPQVVGCDSTCSAEYNQKSLLYGQEINSLCADGNCCVASAPYRMQVFQPSLEAKNGSEDSSGCKLAFLTDQNKFSFLNMTNPQALQYKDYVPANLGWLVNVNDSDISIYCKIHHNETLKSNINIIEGNPYFELG
ncbi:wall-associated receptor kinase-like 8 [Populus alba x Populus x berolinensis]|nr:wall-associated receptor kinase-like 8 [Populus alba x Populus x berolinensis]